MYALKMTASPEARRPMRAAVIAALVTICVNSWTMAPTVTYGGDCGDLITSSYTLGVSHPTGYPLYMMLGRLIAAVPLGEVAARYNFLSVVGGGMTAALVAAIVVWLTAHEVAGLVAALSLAFCYLFWSQSGIAEVYTLSAAFDALLILLALWAAESRDLRLVFAFSLASGFAFTHHLSALLVFVPMCPLLLARRREQLNLKLLLQNGLMFAGPLLLYAYLPIRSSIAPEGFWGDLSQPAAFLAHVSGRLYRSHMFALTSAQVAARSTTLAMIVVYSFFTASLFVIPGLFAGWRRHPGLTLALVATVLFNLAVDLPYDVGDWINFFFPTYVVLAVLVGVGIDSVWRFAFAHVSEPSTLSASLIAITLLAMPAAQVWLAGERASFHGNRRALTQTRETLKQIAPGATAYVKSDELLFSAWYVQRVLRQYTDRSLVSTSKISGAPTADSDQLTTEAIAALKQSATTRRTFVAFWLDADLSPFHLRPAGRVCELTREPLRSKPLSAPVAKSPQVLIPAEVKRELVLPLIVRWHDAPAATMMEFACLHHSLKSKKPPADMRETLPLVSGVSVNPQIVGWRVERKLHPRGNGWQEELLACNTPGESLPGLYDVFGRWKSGKPEAPWDRLGVILVVDV